MVDALTTKEIRLECLRLAVENGTSRGIMEPHLLADKYYEWVMQGSGETRLADNRKDESHMKAKNSRSVRAVG
tara:strand:- start:55 stop:273 length:219 start_codon:yes stop_codon:yes gene_type:complete